MHMALCCFRGRRPDETGGLGETHVGEVTKEDDEFEIYRKRMMLAYRFRPNPLVSDYPAWQRFFSPSKEKKRNLCTDLLDAVQKFGQIN